VEIVADNVQFLGAREEGGSGNGSRFTPQSDVPADTSDFSTVPSGGGGGSTDDDIPF
jgi:single-stranded DNA-binding protein